MELVVKAIVR